MSKRQKIIHTCNKCDAQFPKWQGRCSECGEWGSLGEQSVIKKTEKINNNKSEAAELEILAEVNIKDEQRLKSDIYEFDRVLGGGIVAW